MKVFFHDILVENERSVWVAIMDLKRLYHTIRLWLILSPMKRADYLRKHHVFNHVGKNCMVMFRKVPLYAELISLGNNVWIASNVSLITHDVIHHMLNYKLKSRSFSEYIGRISIEDNVFIGANSTILPNVTIGPDTIIGSNTLVNKNIRGGYMQAFLQDTFALSMNL